MSKLLDTTKWIWLIGGTTESAVLAKAIAKLELPCIVSVTTAAAQALYPQTPLLRVLVGRLDVMQLKQFCQQQHICAILDASHPYAVEISQLAIAWATQHHIPYLRFERLAVAPQATTTVTYLDSFETLLKGNYLDKQRVLLTVGYKALPLFSLWHEQSTLFARILPALASLEVALASGFSSDRIIALRPPLTPELETALWRHWDISLVVTKASGSAGGEDVKHMVAASLGIKLIVITRPAVDYPQQTSDLSVALKFCQRHIL